MKIVFRILSLILMALGSVIVSESVGLSTLHAQQYSYRSGYCCSKATEKLPDNTPDGCTCSGNPCQWGPSGSPNRDRSTAVQASCSGLNSTYNCTSGTTGSLLGTTTITTFIYDHICSGTTTCTTSVSKMLGTSNDNLNVVDCSSQSCP